MEYAKELLENVKENFYVPEAVDEMAECCTIFAKEFGETDIKCAEPYFYYGKALLEMSRLEAEVLGHAMEGIDIYAEEGTPPSKYAVSVDDKDPKLSDHYLNSYRHAMLKKLNK